MRPEEGDLARVWDIVRWGERLARLLNGVTWDEYRGDEEKQVAVERCIEVIGEAARYFSNEFKRTHPEVPWRDIVQQRNVIAHGYFFLEHDRLWEVATVEVPRLLAQLAPLLDDQPDDPERNETEN